jgi:hypothetical protein
VHQLQGNLQELRLLEWRCMKTEMGNRGGYREVWLKSSMCGGVQRGKDGENRDCRRRCRSKGLEFQVSVRGSVL